MRCILYTSISITALLSLFLVTGFYFISSELGQNYLQRAINEEVAPKIGFKIDVEGIQLNFPLKAKISKLYLSDKEGEWLKANNISFNLSLTKNILRDFVINNFLADNIYLLRILNIAPVKDNGNEKNPNMKVSVRNIDIKEAFISPAVSFYSRDIKGNIRGEIQWNSIENSLYFNNSIENHNIIPSLQSNKINLEGKYLFEKESLDAVFKKTLNNKVEINGDINFNLKSKNINANANINEFNFSGLVDKVEGKLDANLKLSGSINKLIIAFNSRVYDLSYFQNNIPEITTAINASLNKNILLGNTIVDVQNLAKANFNYKFLNNNIEFKDIKIQSFKNYILGRLKFNLDKNLVQGNITGKIKSFKEYNSFISEPLEGEIDIWADLYDSKGKQAVKGNIALQKLLLNQVYISEGKIDVKIPNINMLKPEYIKAKLTKISYQNLKINDASLNVTSKKNKLVINTNIDGLYDKHLLKVSSSGVFNIDDFINKKEIELTIKSFQGSYNKNYVYNLGNISFFSSSHSKSIDIPKLMLGDGVFILKGKLRDNKVDVVCTTNNIRLKPLKNNFPEDFSDLLLKSKLVIKGEAINPEMSLGLSIYNNIPDKKYLKFNNNTEVRLKDGKAEFKIHSDKNSILYYYLSGAIPVKFNLNSSQLLSIKDNKDIKADLNYNFNNLSLLKLILPSEHEIIGKSSGKLSISGKYDSPLVNGEIKYIKGKYNYFLQNIELGNINGDFSLKDNIFIVNKLVLEDEEKNQLFIDGKADLRKNKNKNYNFNMKTQNFSLLSNPNINSVFSGDLSIKGDSKSGVIYGSIDSKRIDIYLPREFPSDIPKLNVYKVIERDNEIETDIEKYKYPLALNLKFKAKNKIFIRGWGLDAELGGKLGIKGDVYCPNIIGKFSLVRGRYEEFGKNLKLKQADLLFEGDVPPSPYITVVGSVEESGVEIMPVISGSILKPSLTIESSPEHSKDDALSLLLFGEESSNLSSFQAFQLASSLKRITTKSDSGFNPLRKIRDLFGIDDINVNGSDSGTSVEVQKYISDDVRLKVGQNGQSDGTVGVEVDLTPNISVESGASNESGNSAGINWKYDY